MKMAMIAAAGVSSRFNENEEEAVLKGIYTIADNRKTLLYSILGKCDGFEKVVLVGGYQYEKLMKYVDSLRGDFPFEIQMVYNPYFREFGSGYTLKVGLEQCLNGDCTEITMIEGDLFFDRESFESIKNSRHSVAAYNTKIIYSKKAVIAYVNQEKKLKYVFSANHGAAQIPEPFLEIYNSGQIWKFLDVNRVRMLVKGLPGEVWQGTNLQFIERYFSGVKEGEWEMLPLKVWENCNTREDYLEYAKRL